jgi:hypothetical protein
MKALVKRFNFFCDFMAVTMSAVGFGYVVEECGLSNLPPETEALVVFVFSYAFLRKYFADILPVIQGATEEEAVKE